MTILGIALIIYGLKKSKILLVGGIVLTAVGLFLIICTIILASAVRNSEPNPKFDNVSRSITQTVDLSGTEEQPFIG